MWKCSVDVGEGEPRTIGAALREAYPDGLAGKKVIVLANTKPRNLAGFKSQGMLVCATLDDTTRLVEVDAAPARALFNGLPAADPATPNQMNNKKLWPTAQASLSTADKRVVLGGLRPRGGPRGGVGGRRRRGERRPKKKCLPLCSLPGFPHVNGRGLGHVGKAPSPRRGRTADSVRRRRAPT